MDGLNANQFQGNHMNDKPFLEDLVTLSILLFNFNNVDGNIIGELGRRGVQRDENTVRHMKYNKHICYVSKFNAAF